MKNKIKLLFTAIVISAFSFAAWLAGNIFSINQESGISSEFLQELAALNAKYHLVSAELLDKPASPYTASLLNTDVFKASVIDNEMPEEELIIKLKLNKNTGNDLENIFILKLQTNSDINKISEEYDKLNSCSYAEPNYTIELDDSEDVGYIKILKKPIMDDGQETSGQKKVIIALIDSGVDTSHPDLKGKLVDGWDFISNQKNENDNIGHGTHVAGIIAKNSKSALIMPLKFTDGTAGDLTNIVRAIKYAVEHGARIINLSLGLKEESMTLKEAVDYAKERNVIVAAAAGNKNSDERYYPAGWPEVISVAAVNDKGEKVFISNYGDWVKFSALGQDIYSTAPNGRHVYKTGTSQAVPVVTAKIADILYTMHEFGKNEKDLFTIVYHSLAERSEKAAGTFADELGGVID